MAILAGNTAATLTPPAPVAGSALAELFQMPPFLRNQISARSMSKATPTTSPATTLLPRLGPPTFIPFTQIAPPVELTKVAPLEEELAPNIVAGVATPIPIPLIVPAAVISK